MGVFTGLLQKASDEIMNWHYVAYDQLHENLLPDFDSKTSGLLFIETKWKARRLPYHKQKLALLLSNQRHFALEMQEKGYSVRYIFDDRPYSDILNELISNGAKITACDAAELNLREQYSKVEGLCIVPHEGWMTSKEDFLTSQAGKKTWKMDPFYRLARKKHDIMIEDGKPVGGKWSLDFENRLPWDKAVPLPQPIFFECDDITDEIIKMIEQDFSNHPGQIDRRNLPSSIEQARSLWNWAKENVMVYFGPYEDAMTTEHRTLFHTTISSLLNLSRLLPTEIVKEAEYLDIPLNSKEGFIRQIIGWREFVKHVHDLTNGFVDDSITNKARPGAGWEGEWASPRNTPNILTNSNPLPPTFWGSESGMLCLDTAISDVIETGYTHHIPRLMVLANIGNLLGINPRELTDWFWAMFTDAYDWVVEPNVLAMGTYAVGGLMTTKPYVSGTPYIKKMGDYCGDCSLHFKKSCPISDMYWNFLDKNKDLFEGNIRLAMPLRTLGKKSEESKQVSKNVTNYVIDTLAEGKKLESKTLESIKSSK